MESKLVAEKVALVTGAGRGIGAEIAKSLAAHGAHVVVNDIGGSETGIGKDQTPATQTLTEIRRAGGSAEVNFDSVADNASAKKMIQQALDCFGRIDIVVNNAGILRDTIFHKMEEEDWDAVINV
ncbi:MAG: SDR family NAD(P)-dependent oxidoreductase, partial [Rhodospirillales bacterium]|nr:SDR family NAD(P)-dependent oxidoreductase [Rhodospirillales bacterium]